MSGSLTVAQCKYAIGYKAKAAKWLSELFDSLGFAESIYDNIWIQYDDEIYRMDEVHQKSRRELQLANIQRNIEIKLIDQNGVYIYLGEYPEGTARKTLILEVQKNFLKELKDDMLGKGVLDFTRFVKRDKPDVLVNYQSQWKQT